MIKPYGSITEDEEQDPYSGFSDSNGQDPNTPAANPAAPKPYAPPAKQQDDAPPPDPTFAELEGAGRARPPMPVLNLDPATDSDVPPPADPVEPPPVAPPADPVAPPVVPVTAPTLDTTTPPPVAVPKGIPPGVTPDHLGTLSNIFRQATGREPTQQEIEALAPSILNSSWDDITKVIGAKYAKQAPAAPTKAAATSNPILDLLTGGAQGTNESDLEKATSAKALERLKSPSPYGSKEVRDEYDWLAGNIDDQYDMDSRGLDESMAARGLYGSAGKDFHSGRLSDLNVGKRTAKTSLAQDLATKYATSKGQYDASAIDSAGNVSGQEDAQQRAWLNSLMGYGDDAFNHDLASAEFGQRQNESEQDFLMRMLQAGYGV